MIVGDMDSVSDRALTCGAEVVVHAYRDGRAPGPRARQRARASSRWSSRRPAPARTSPCCWPTTRAPSSSSPSARTPRLVEFLDKGRAGMASTFLTRLRVGDKLVDAKGVRRLYRQRISTLQVALLAVAGLLALGVALAATSAGQTFYGLVGRALRRAHSWVTGFFTEPRPEPSRSTSGRLELMIDSATTSSRWFGVPGARRGHRARRRPAEGAIAVGCRRASTSCGKTSATRASSSNTAQAGITNRDTFVTQVAPGLVADQLGGRSVVLVDAPGGRGRRGGAAHHDTDRGGAKVTGRIDVQDAWADPSNRAARDKAVAALAAVAGSGTATSSPPRRGPPAPAARRRPPGPPRARPGTSAATPAPVAAAGGDPAGDAGRAPCWPRRVSPPTWRASASGQRASQGLLDGLSKAGLIDVNGDVAGPRHAGRRPRPPASPRPSRTKPAPATSHRPRASTPYLAHAGAGLDASSTGAVVVGPASAAPSRRRARGGRAQSSSARPLSTVDTGGTQMGDVATVFALREQQLGGRGQLRFRRRCKAPLPTRAAGGSCRGAGAGSRRARMQGAVGRGVRHRCSSEPPAGSERSRRAPLRVARGVRPAGRRPPGGAERWARSNHRGEPLTLSRAPRWPPAPAVALRSVPRPAAPRVRAAGLLAVAGAAAFGVLRRPGGSRRQQGAARPPRGARPGRGHDRRRSRSPASAPPGSRPRPWPSARAPGCVDVLPAAGARGRAANLVNLLDLRPGRALKVALLAPPRCSARTAGGRRRGRSRRPAPAALLPDDLGERAMLGDTGANAAGALLGVARWPARPSPAGWPRWPAVVALTLASEKVSFTR